MLNINFVLLCWILPSIPPPPCGDHVTLRGSGALSLTVMVANHTYVQPAQPNQEEQDLIAFLRQNVAR